MQSNSAPARACPDVSVRSGEEKLTGAEMETPIVLPIEPADALSVEVESFEAYPLGGGPALCAAATSHVGMVRTRNEDAFGTADAGRLLIIADGMGGHDAGDVASRIVVDTIRELLGEPCEVEDAERALLLEAAIEAANLRVQRQAAGIGSARGMGATVAALWLGERCAVYAHVGDCRIYLARDARLEALTLDHSPYGDLVRAGLLRRDQYDVCPSTHIVTRSVGLNPTVAVDSGAVPLQEGDRFLLCSDGLTDEVNRFVLHDVMVSGAAPEGQVELLARLALEAGGHDNVTVAVVCSV